MGSNYLLEILARDIDAFAPLLMSRLPEVKPCNTAISSPVLKSDEPYCLMIA
ncbi:MAG: hypothetical protein ACI8R9_001481 [Paraglaciecola sp.]|jgi:hypothetical protein